MKREPRFTFSWYVTVLVANLLVGLQLTAPFRSAVAEPLDSHHSRPLSLGPTQVSNLHPFAQFHLNPLTVSNTSLCANCFGTTVLQTISNTVNRESGEFLVDSETRSTEMLISFGATENLQLDLKQILYYRGAGFTDHIIDEWHQAFSLPRGPRGRIPQDEFIIEGDNLDGSSFSIKDKGVGLSDLQYGIKYRLNSNLSLSLFATVPTGGSKFGHNGSDIGAGLLFGSSNRWIRVNSSLNVVHQSDRQIQGLHFASEVATGTFHISAPVNDNLQLFLGLLLHSAIVEEIHTYPRYGVYLDVGVKRALFDGWEAEMLIRENPYPDDSTTDISFAIALSTLFPPSGN